MKKYILILSLFISISAFAQIPKYPFGAATVATLTVDNDSLYPSITNSMTYHTLSDTLVGNTLFIASVGAGVKAGDSYYIRTLNGLAVRTLTFSTASFKAPSITTTASKTKLLHFIFDGSVFVLVSSTQID